MLSSLTPEEREHYEWLISGLTTGARALIGIPGTEDLIRRTLTVVEELFLEVTRRADASAPDWLARDLEQKLVAELVESAADEPEVGLVDGHAADAAELFEAEEKTEKFLRAAIGERAERDSGRTEDRR